MLTQTSLSNVSKYHLVQPPREESIQRFRIHQFTINRIQQPKHAANIKRKRKCEASENVIPDLADQWSVTCRCLVGANKIIQKCKGEVNTLSNLCDDKN